MKKFFPLSAKAKESVGSLIIAIIIYVGVFAVVKFACNILHIVPLLGTLVGNLITTVVYLYCGIGVVLALLYFFKVIK